MTRAYEILDANDVLDIESAYTGMRVSVFLCVYVCVCVGAYMRACVCVCV